MRSRLGLAAATSLAILAACGRCGAGPARSPEGFLPRDATAALVVPNLGAAAGEWRGLLEAARSVPAAAPLAEAHAALKAQLGLDPLEQEGLAAAGLDPSRGAAAALLPGGALLLALPLADGGRWDALVARLGRDRLGAAHREEAEQGGARSVAFSRGAGSPPALAYAAAGRTALLSAGAEAPATVLAAALRPAAEALPAVPSFIAAREALGGGHGLAAFWPPGSPLLRELPAARDGGALGFRTGAFGLSVQAVLLLPPERAAVWREVAGGDGADSAGREELLHLPADTFLAARFGGEPAALGRRLSYALPPRLAAGLRQAGLDLRADFFDLLAPGAALGLSLAPTFDVGAAARGAEAARDPFREVNVAAGLRVRDATRLRAVLDRLARNRAVGVAPRPAGNGWSARVGGGALDILLDGDRLWVASGPGRLEALVAGRGYRAPSSTAIAALSTGGAGAVLDVGALVTSFRSLPEEAYGTGPDAFVMRSLADRVVEPASHLKAVSLRVEVLPAAARLDLDLEAAVP